MIYLDENWTLKFKMGEIDTTRGLDYHVFYSEVFTCQQRDEKIGRAITQADSFEVTSGTSAATATDEVSMLIGPQARTSTEFNTNTSTSRRYKCRVVVCNKDTISRTLYLFLENGSTERYLTYGISIPAGGTFTWDENGPISEGTALQSVTAGSGLANSGTTSNPILDVNVDNSSIEISADTLRVKADGITTAMMADQPATSRLIGSNAASTNTTSLTLNTPFNLSGGSLNLDTNGISNSYIRQGTARTVIGRSANSTGDVADIATTAGKFLGDRGSALGAFFPTQILSKSSAYPLVTDDYGATVLVTAAATITLPAPATVGSGWWCCIKKTVASGSDVTIARNASETIDGRSASDILKAQYAFAVYMTDGTNWHVISANDWLMKQTTSFTNYGTSGQYFDATFSDATTSLSIPPGEWDIEAVVDAAVNGAVSWTTNVLGVSTTSGNSGTGLVFGDNAVNFIPPSATIGPEAAISLPGNRVLLATSTSYYLKLRADRTNTPQYVCRLSARRVG